MIHANEEVYSLWMEVHNPAKTGSVCVYAKVNTAIYPFQWSDICTQATFCPRIFTIDFGTAKETKLQLTVAWKHILATEIHCCCELCCLGTLSTFVLQICEIGNLIAITVWLVFESWTFAWIDCNIMETIKLKWFIAIGSKNIIIPCDNIINYVYYTL